MDLRLPQSRQHGFTLIELMITLLIFGILLSLAGPPFQAWVRGTQLRTYAESFQSAVQLARAEAIKRNAYVELILTNDAISPAKAGSVTENTKGTAWLIRACPDCVNLTSAPTSDTPSYPFIEGKTVAEGNSSRFKLLANQSLLRFDGLGRADKTLSLIVSANDSQTDACTPETIDKGSVVQSPARVCLLVDEGGNTRLCLPDAPKENPSSCLR
jgi:type IV fimbrial biogenesis protein FimT